jgi:hypothetical protein
MASIQPAIGRLLWRARRAFVQPQAAALVAPGFEGYGGATITRRVDGAGAKWIACCARGPDGFFGFYAFKNGVNVPLSPRVSGRGSIDDDGWWIAWEGSTKYEGQLPQWTPKGMGGYTVAPNASVRVFVDKDGFDGKQSINLATFGIPPCTAVNVRITVDGDVGRVFRCGPPTADPNLQTSAMLTVTALGITARAYESGVVSVTPARTLLVMTENGPIAAGFVDVTGWWG